MHGYTPPLPDDHRNARASPRRAHRLRARPMTRRGWTIAAGLWVLSDLLVFALYFGMGWEIAAAAWVLFDLAIFAVFFAGADGGGQRPQHHASRET